MADLRVLTTNQHAGGTNMVDRKWEAVTAAVHRLQRVGKVTLIFTACLF